MSEHNKAIVAAVWITASLICIACIGATIAAMIGLRLPYIQKLTQQLQVTRVPAEDCRISEFLTVPFTGSYHAAYTQHSYKGKVLIKVFGTGQSAGTQYTDAFYLFTDSEGRLQTPQHPTDFILTINGDFAQYLIQDEQIPAYRSDHIYDFEIIALDGNLSFGISDGFASDNTGYYAIILCQP
jgi:hypothetical protein